MCKVQRDRVIMGSSINSIDCTNCGGHGWVDDNYKDGIKVTDCDHCKYTLKETYDIETKKVLKKKEAGKNLINKNL